jgi:putative acetyltransferase
MGIAVACGLRGRGVGTALLPATIEGRTNVPAQVGLSVFLDNAAAIALYRKFGIIARHRVKYRREW